MVERKVYYSVTVNPPEIVRSLSNVTLHFESQKVSMKDLSTGKDQFRMGFSVTDSIQADIAHVVRNFTPPGYFQNVALSRDVTHAEVKRQKLSFMPGFKFKFYYSGMGEVTEAKYLKENEAFIRIDSISKL